jgi:hypothetical protein
MLSVEKKTTDIEYIKNQTCTSQVQKTLSHRAMNLASLIKELPL